ncbi:AhpD-like protein [Hyaloraphidium curvatum]|nr:AhpD-like protein [Hyaloraphidium curvatum]
MKAFQRLTSRPALSGFGARPAVLPAAGPLRGAVRTSSGKPALPKQPVLPKIEYENASPRVQAIYDDIVQTYDLKGSHQVNDFWKVYANHPDAMESTWRRMKVIMAEGELSALMKELLYVAVSISNGCDYCVASHTASARKAGLTDGMYAEMLSVITLANETNRLAFAYRLNADQMYEKLWAKMNEARLQSME